MISASQSTLSLNNLKILRLKVTKNLTNLPKKFCKFPSRSLDMPLYHALWLLNFLRYSMFVLSSERKKVSQDITKCDRDRHGGTTYFNISIW